MRNSAGYVQSVSVAPAIPPARILAVFEGFYFSISEGAQGYGIVTLKQKTREREFQVNLAFPRISMLEGSERRTTELIGNKSFVETGSHPDLLHANILGWASSSDKFRSTMEVRFGSFPN